VKRACIFVDGENFRYSLRHLFPSERYSFTKADYLPQADWHRFFAALASRFDCELFRTYWYVSYELATGKFGIEKGVDTQLSIDMILLSDIYDAAIIVSGDADFLPAVAAAKDRGKLVYTAAFLDANGQQLHGGARRLNNAVDSCVELEFETMRRAMNIEARSPCERTSVHRAHVN
jgi:uncharacterized LabA/DUF88 family protein